MINKREQLEIIFFLDSISAIEALKALLGITEELAYVIDADSELAHLRSSSFLAKIEKSGKWSQELRFAGMSFQFGKVTAWGHCFVFIKQLEAGKPADWNIWLAPFIKKQGFVQAWIADLEFDYWQNAEQPIQYELANRDYSKLPLKSNGFPPPLQAMWIDISNNPGKRVIKEGYVEAVGEKMWLSPIFKERIGGIDIDRLHAAGWTVDTKSIDGITILTAPKGSFSEEIDTKYQQKLRAALYD